MEAMQWAVAMTNPHVSYGNPSMNTCEVARFSDKATLFSGDVCGHIDLR